MRLLPLILIPLLPLAGLFASASAAVRDSRYAAVQQLVPDGLTPRYFVDRSHPLFKREGSCGDDAHSCLDIGHGDRCCDNNSYCYVNSSNQPKCCAIGQACTSDNPCPATAVRCSVTRTITLTASSSSSSRTTATSSFPSSSSSRAAAAGARTTTTTVLTGCCGRACPQTSFYLCAPSLGGNCCPFDSNCQAGGHCVSTKTSPPPGLTPVVANDGCTTSQFRCPDGNGCCDNGQACTSFGGSGYCSTATGGPTSTLAAAGDDDSSSSSSRGGGSGSLSPGAEAGIAVGAVVGGGLLVAAAAWFYLTRRRKARHASPYNINNNNGPAAHDAPMAIAPTTSSPDAAAGHQRWEMVSSVTPSGAAVTDAGTLRSPSSAPPDHHQHHRHPPVELGADRELLSEVSGEGVLSPRSGVSSMAFGGTELRTPETLDGRFELHGSEGNWPMMMPSPASPLPSPPLPDVNQGSEKDRP
ncbi:hypothetical protein BBK36DRAFT_1138789 [Trichoderma citrinoviride]|uniref:Mid2 domain-containing protein n=1 Tax=Trichoderma citrinoviride TaxID=58853 RepID=A0A2T4BHD5_9HYPO|nr:hypothetical protein BBK36DRAFT_1138789 [Trichoderma citrinoviride]PTB68688.1 hypothetical protein BBK36DRAFT_1138789 [Trichoderma citrinoviride]